MISIRLISPISNSNSMFLYSWKTIFEGQFSVKMPTRSGKAITQYEDVGATEHSTSLSLPRLHTEKKPNRGRSRRSITENREQTHRENDRSQVKIWEQILESYNFPVREFTKHH